MQTLVIRLPERVARHVRSFMESGGHGYESLNEFVEVALTNQLNMETGQQKPLAASTMGDVTAHERGSVQARRSKFQEVQEDALPQLLDRPVWQYPGLAEPAASNERMFALTNRLSPVKIATRVLSNLARDGSWPTLRAFQEQSALSARHLGVRLREEDRLNRHVGAQRRWVGYPIGPDERAALDRFVFSFTITDAGGNATGPLAALGLATVENNIVALTRAGWELAEAPSPLLDEAMGGTVSEEEAEILRQQVRKSREEAIAVREFLSDVKRSAGSQERLDELMAVRFPGWTQNLTIAHRSAMLGRLGDMRALSVSGRGPGAEIQLLAAAEELEAD